MSTGQQMMDDRRRTTGSRLVNFWLLIFVCALFCLLGTFEPLQAQDKESPLITFKQRLLHQKHEDNIEKIDSFSKLHLMIAGNIYQTEKHAAYAYDKTTGKYDYKSELKYVQPLLNLGDITIANLKTSFGNNSKNMFSSPDEFGLALKYAGINAVMHANVHTANISKATLKRTDDVLDEYDIFHTGAFNDNIQRNGNYPLIMNKKGFRIALLNYTNLTSRPAISRDFVINEIDKTMIDRDMHLAHAYKPDFIIVYFDWGANMQDIPSYAQQELAQYVFQAGANLVVGTHPNTPMRIDMMNYSYNGSLHEGIIAYSLGNLIGSNEEIRNRNGYIIDMELQKNNFTTETKVNDWGVIPVYTYYDTTTVKGKTKVFSVPCANVESGDIFPKIPYIEKRRAVNSAYEVRKLLGNTADEIQYNLNELIVNNVEESIDITNAPLNNKYNPKREDDIKPSAAPELPVTAEGSNNAPSLALLYEQPVPGAPAPTTTSSRNAKTQKKNDAEGSSYLTQRKKAEAIIDGPATAEPTATAQPNTGTTTATTETNKPGEKTNSETNTEATTGTAKTNNATGKNTSTVKAEENTPAAKSDETAEGGAKTKTKKGTPTTTGTTAKKDQSVNTNYHTTGNDYELNDPQHSAKTTPAAAPKEKEKETGVEVSSTGANGISTGLSTELTGNVEMAKAEDVEMTKDTLYRIQFYALKTYIPLDTNYYTHLKGYDVRMEGGLYKYLLGVYKNYEECERYWKSQILPRYRQSFIVKFVNGKRVLK